MRYLVFFFMVSFCLSALAEIEPSDSYLDFFEVEVGESEFLEFELQNNHPFPVSIYNIDLNADFSIFDINDNCLGVLHPGDYCYIEVIFSPNDVDDYLGYIEVETSTNEWIQVSLEGEGVRW